MRKVTTLLACILCIFGTVSSQHLLSWETFSLDKKASLRGIAAVSDQECWVTGTNGTVAKTLDGGQTWTYFRIPHADSLDFRDIEVFNANEVLVLSIGTGKSSKIFRTADGGKTWKVVFQNTEEEGFFDALTFWNKKDGFMQGDPIGGRLYLLYTSNSGKTWREVPFNQRPVVQDGEYAFAASGSQMTAQNHTVWIGTGGTDSHILRTSTRKIAWQSIDTPIIQGQASQGIFSVAFKNKKSGIAVGGDYTKENEGHNNIIRTNDGGYTWQLINTAMDYRSAVRYFHHTIITTGPSGSDISFDDGNSWQPINGQGYHTLDVHEKSQTVWAAGRNGRIGRIQLSTP